MLMFALDISTISGWEECVSSQWDVLIKLQRCLKLEGKKPSGNIQDVGKWIWAWFSHAWSTLQSAGQSNRPSTPTWVIGEGAPGGELLNMQESGVLSSQIKHKNVQQSTRKTFSDVLNSAVFYKKLHSWINFRKINKYNKFILICQKSVFVTNILLCQGAPKLWSQFLSCTNKLAIKGHFLHGCHSVTQLLCLQSLSEHPCHFVPSLTES